MPTLRRQAGLRFHFYSSDRGELPHAHVYGNGGRAKVWLAPDIKIVGSHGYDVRQKGVIARIARDHRDEWLKAWRDFFRRG